ncbi:MAG: deoxyguanosinetriphosphate triphosphohydrolase, partial [Pseudanabaena sp.]
ASAEAQIAAIADDIAYNNHDLDDGLRAGLFTLDEVGALPVIGDALAAARAAAPDAPVERLAPEMIRRVISRMVGDVAAEATRRLAGLKPTTVADIRAATRFWVLIRYKLQIARNVGAFIFALILLM